MNETLEELNTPRIVEERWQLTYHHAAGRTASRFFNRLQRDATLEGRRCPQCKRVLVPPRSFCDRCFVPTEEWVEVGPRGTLEMFTVVYQKFEGLPDPPYAFGYVLLEGADTAIINFIRGLDLRDGNRAGLRVGAPVTAVFSSERSGQMADFWFELVDE